MNSEQKRAGLAVILSGLVLFSWQYFYGNKTIESKKTESAATTTEAKAPELSKQEPATEAKLATTGTQTLSDANLKTDELSISTRGFLSIKDLDSKNAYLKFNELFGDDAFALYVHDGVVEHALSVEQVGETELRVFNSTLGVEGKLYLDQGKQFKISITSQNPVHFLVKMKLKPSGDSNKERRFVTYGNDITFYSISSAQDEGKISWLGLDYNYHLFALIFDQKLAGKITATETGEFNFFTTTKAQKLDSSMVLSRKDYDRLSTLGNSLELSVDFGVLGILAVPILRSLQFLYKYIPNYGIGIILLTIVMRIITFPLQYKSFVSMKRMQKIQPELTSLREKYKEDPQRMQKETMELFKKAGANPLGGCLPMLAQMPIFFAFYKVLYASVELVGAPFYFWIADLSLKDPFFILPILMTGLMFLQQKMTPSGTSDPTQKKIMLLMPLVFGFIMKDLPSGLVLYICVSTVVGILQQLLVFRTADK